MSDDARALGVICARGGSKGLPGKNVMRVGGKPMIAWSIDAARGAKTLARAVVSSDDAEILEAAKECDGDVPFVRPAALAGDDSRIEDVLIHALDTLGEAYDYVVLLQATSPMRLAGDIDDAVALCIRTGAPACVTVTESAKSPYIAYRLGEDGRIEPVIGGWERPPHRQALPRTFAPNGAVYVARTDWFRANLTFYRPETVAHVMPAERAVDVDTRYDWLVADALLRDRQI